MLIRLMKSRLIYTVLWLMAMSLVGNCAETEKFQVSSGNTTLEFLHQNGHITLSGIADRSKSREFVKPGARHEGLWRLEFRPQNGQEAAAAVLDEATLPVTRVELSPKKDFVRLHWTGLRVGMQSNAADVTVTISAIKGTSLTDWRIAVDNRVRQLGLWHVDFPRVNGLFVGNGGKAALPFGMGMVVSDPVHNEGFGFNRRYPEVLYSMQFATLSERGSCLYLGTHDPHAYIKEMNFNREQDGSGLAYQIKQFPPDMGKPERDYTQPYPCVLGIIDGDWVDAAKLYRKWVLANSDWMRGKLPLSQRRDMPDWFKRLPFWVGMHRMTEANIKRLEALLPYMGVPTAIHMYHWHQIEFDTKYPDFWPPYPQTAGYIQRLHALGAKVMPYTNGHLMDELAPSWEPDKAWRFTAKNPDGKPYLQIGGDDRRLDAMCPATTYWQTKFNDLTTKLVRDLDVDGIYMDQVAATTPVLCFDATHGHPLGGGNYWVTGHACQIANVRRAAAKIKRHVFLTTESAAEPYDYDAFLRCNEGAPFLTPIWQLVYSGYRLSFGFYFYEEPEWVVKLATQYLWGVQIGWAHQRAPEEFADPRIVAFQREVARARYASSDYLALGEMLRPPTLKGDFARVKATWQNFATKMPIDWPAVRSSLWRAPNGSAGVALVNMHTEPQTVTVGVGRKQVGFGPGPVRMRVLYPASLKLGEQKDGDILSCKVTLPPLTAALIVLERTPQ